MTDREKLDLIKFVVEEKWGDRTEFYTAFNHSDKARAGYRLAEALSEIKEVLNG